MSKIETPLTTILIIVCFALFSYSVVSGHNERIEKENSEKALAEKTLLEARRDSSIASRSLNTEVKHDKDPETNIIPVALYASSSYDNEGDSLEYYWKQISGNNVADINDSREKSVLNFEAESGNYGFELTVTDNYGASCVDTHWVNVAPEPNSCPVVVIKD
ncbi:MAG: hypothetical protein H8E16_14510 [Flavobacteriales bacterium]|nr:hypothetical protein [Flavobacteriales bacterium]